MSKNIALVLSGGGARGLAHVGVINELVRQDFKITSIAGTSMGALVGGMYASEQLASFQEWICSLTKKDMLSMVDINLYGKGFIKGEKIIEAINSEFNNRNIEDLKIPYCAVATDVIEGKEVHFTDGRLFDAIRASIAIPTVFTPHELDGKYYVDGGLVNQVPINCVKRTKGDKVVVVYVNAPKDNLPPDKSIKDKENNAGVMDTIKQKVATILPPFSDSGLRLFNLIDKSLSIMLHTISELSMKNNNPDILIELSRETYGLFEFDKAADIIKAGETEAREVLKNQDI